MDTLLLFCSLTCPVIRKTLFGEEMVVLDIGISNAESGVAGPGAAVANGVAVVVIAGKGIVGAVVVVSAGSEDSGAEARGAPAADEGM